jgi:hypothetical protein
MKRVIKTRQLPQTKLKHLAEECGIEFEVKLENSKTKIHKSTLTGAQRVYLLKIDNHYLLND